MLPEPFLPLPAPAHLSAAARAAIEQPIVRDAFPAPDDVDGWLALVRDVDADIMARQRALGAFPVTSVLDAMGGVPTYVLTPHEADADGPIVLDVHGGALIFGGGALAGVMCEPDAAATGAVHWAPDYRMPPRHPFPAALDDLVAVYRALLERRGPDRIVVSGTSAGGGLAAALLLRLEAEGLPMPAGLVLQTPEVDLTESGDTFATLAHVSVGLQSLREVNLLYAAGRELHDPLLSPLFGVLGGFPPTILVAGTRDLFLSNTVRMHRALRDAGVDAELHVIDARPHAGFGAAPEEGAVAAELRRFVAERTGRR